MRALLRLLPLGLALLLSPGCEVPDTRSELWACVGDSDCLEGRRCVGGVCRGQAVGGSCLPTTCAASAKACGPLPDLCGATLDCGSCVRTLDVTFTIAGGTGFTRSADVLVDVEVAPTGLPGGFSVRFANEDDPYAMDAVPVGRGLAWPLDAPDGAHTIRAEVTDTYGNTAEVTGSVVIDGTPPTGDFTIANGASFTRERVVEVVSSFVDETSGLAELCLSNLGGTPECHAPSNEPILWTLPDADREAALVLRATDAAGNTTERLGRIVLDRVAPRLTVEVSGRPTYVTSDAITLAVNALDEGGVATLCPSNDGATYDPADCRANDKELPWTLGAEDGRYEVHVRAEDLAGNTAVGSTVVSLDRIPPALALSTGAGVVVEGVRYVRTTPVALELDVTDATSGPATVQLSPDGATYGAPLAFAPSVSFFPAAGDGPRVAWARVSDGAGLTGDARSVEFFVDTTPPTGSFTFVGGATTNRREVSLSLDATDAASGPWSVELSNDGTTWSAPAPVSATLDWLLPEGDGVKEVQLRLADRAGNTAVFRRTVTVDSRPPTASVLIAGGAAHVTASLVRLAVAATDEQRLTELCIANGDDVFTECRPWDITLFDWTLAEGEGSRSVRVRVRDDAGNVTIATDTTFVDLTPPTLTATTTSGRVVSGTRYLKASPLVLDLSAADPGGSGVASLELSSDGLQWSAPVPFASSRNVSVSGPDGDRLLFARARDVAGLISAEAEIPYFFDATAPTARLQVNGGASDVATGAVTLELAASDGAGSGLDTMAFRNEDTASFPAGEPVGATKEWTLSAGSGPKRVTGRITDRAGNAVEPFTLVTVDPNVPTVTCTVNNGDPTPSLPFVRVSCSVETSVPLRSFSVSDGSTTQEFGGTLPSDGDTTPRVLTFALPDVDGTYTLTVRATTTTARVGSAVSTLALDRVAPTLTSVTLAGGAPWTRTATIPISVVASDAVSGLAQLCTRAPSGTPNCRAFAATSTVTLFGTDGAGKSVLATVKDAAGLESLERSDTIGLDGTPPTGTTVTIAGGAAYVRDSTVALTLTGSDATSGRSKFAISTDGGNTFESEVTWNASPQAATVTLAEGAGARTVIVRFTDVAGNTVTAPDDITVDTAAPTISALSIAGGAEWSGSGTVAVTLAASDNGQLAQYCLKNAASPSPDPTDTCWKTYATTITGHALAAGDGTRSVFAWVRDSAGNVSASATDSVGVDTTIPSTSGFTLASGAAWTRVTPVTAAFAANGTGSPVARWCLGTTTPPTTCTNGLPPASALLDLPPGDGTKQAYFRVFDTVGLASAIATASIGVDATPPVLSAVRIASGADYTAAAFVPVALTATDSTSGLATFALAQPGGGTFAIEYPYAATFNTTLQPGTGLKTLSVRVTDRAGNSSTASDTVTVDQQPPTGTVSIDNGAAVVSTSAPPLGLTWSDDGLVTHVCLATASGPAPAAGATCWRTVEATISNFALLAGDGTRSIFAYFKDAAGNVSSEFSDTATVDTTIPIVNSVSINAGAAWTTSTAVTLALVADGTGSTLTQVCLGSANPPTTCQPYSASPTFTLPVGDGTKTVFVRVIDASNIGSAVASDTIGLDTAPPAMPSIAIAGGEAFVNTTSVPVTLGAVDSSSGVATVAFSTDGTTFGPPVAYTDPATGTLSGTAGVKTLWARVTDAAGLSVTASDTITLDTTPPTGTVLLNAGAANTNSPASVSVGLTSSDDSSGVTHVCLQNTAIPNAPLSTNACWRSIATTIAPFPLESGDGTRTVYARFRDAAGNVSATTASDAISVDTTPPGTTSFNAATLAGEHRAFTADWAAATDNTGGTGLAGYQVGWSTNGTTFRYSPLQVTRTVTQRGPFPNGRALTIRLKSVDLAGNEALGPTTTVTPDYPWSFRGRRFPTHSFVTVAKAGTAYLAAAARGLIVRSTDSGLTWTRVDPLVDVNVQAISFKDASSGLFVGGNGTIGYTSDGGLTWRASRIDVTVSLNGIAYVSTDAGTGRDRWVLVGSSGQLWYADVATYDGSATWTQVAVPAGVAASKAFRDIGVCTSCPAVGQTTIVVAGDNALLKSTDLGLTYTSLATCTETNVEVEATPDRSVLWTYCDTLQSQKLGTRTERGAAPAGLTNPRAMVATSDTKLTLVGYTSPDGKVFTGTYATGTATTATWVDEPLPPDLRSLWDAVATPTGMIAAADYSDLLVKNGPLWTRPPGVIVPGALNLSAAVSDASRVWASTTAGNVFRAGVSAATEEVLSPNVGMQLNGLGLLGSTLVAVGVGGKTSLSVDGGAAWTPATAVPGMTVAWQSIRCNPLRCYAAGLRQAMARYEPVGGWSLLNAPGPSGTPGLNSQATATGTAAGLITVGDNGTIFLNDGADRAAQSSPVTRGLNAVATDGTRYIAVGNVGTILRAPAATGPWTKIAEPDGVTSDLTSVNLSGSDWLIGGFGVVLRSDDLGLTWRSIASPTSRPITGISRSGSGTWLVGEAGLVGYAPKPWDASFEPGTIDGALDPIVGTTVSGYACAVTIGESLTIDLVTSGTLASGTGFVFQTVTADRPGDATSQAACLTGTFPHRFTYTLTTGQATSYARKTVYAYARSPLGLSTDRLDGSVVLP